ncbi:MAG: Uncharacterized protein conserved in bacteria containing thioredoxin-like domain [Phormidesmis priestleyi Ana]|uniref:Uncharacterized protein conserved in bacteria containing thioredoxin-like domain n=1 Tax=Phormidesmis priestleyi Ana TaxID=1666911 RepID=A0A0P8BRG8_9CYAN|nr:MAG: Uncharacterized protein conserved in bacteria containing thioredoxin-like domain [Phormidesmis priestleyi Ana]
MSIDSSAHTVVSQPLDQPCRYCSETSRANGEDPIGTAVTAKLWLFIEVPQPWAKNPWGNESADLLELFQQIERDPQLWRELRILAIAPDKTASTKGDRHVFFYRLPKGAACAYTQQHYHVPISALCALVRSLIWPSVQLAVPAPFRPPDPSQPDPFKPYLQPAPSRTFFVCTHTSYDTACGRFGTPIYRTIKKRYAQANLSVWQTTHFGGHHFAPTLIDFPTGQFWGHLVPEVLDTLVYRQGDVTQLQQFYRGWSGFEPWAQIAERSLWMRQGWNWLTTPRSAQFIRQDPGRFTHRLARWILSWIPTNKAQVLLKKLTKKLTWAEVEITWEATDQPRKSPSPSRYRARVKMSHEVVSQMRSGTTAPLTRVPQYRVHEY